MGAIVMKQLGLVTDAPAEQLFEGWPDQPLQYEGRPAALPGELRSSLTFSDGDTLQFFTRDQKYTGLAGPRRKAAPASYGDTAATGIYKMDAHQSDGLRSRPTRAT